jgi:hypothetical protein
MRWPKTDGKAECPTCDCPICQPCLRGCGQWRWRCKARRADFFVTLGTSFCLARAAFANLSAGNCHVPYEVKVKSILVFSRELDLQYESAFVLALKKPMPNTLRTSPMMSMVNNSVTKRPRVARSTTTTARARL